MMGLSLPHKIYIDNYYIGIVKGKSATINGFPLGRYNIMIQSMIPYFSSSSTIEIKEGSNTVEFKDKEKIWDILFTIDIVLWIVKRFITLEPTINLWYEIITNGYLILWIVYELSIRKNTSKYSKHNNHRFWNFGFQRLWLHIQNWGCFCIVFSRSSE